MTDLRYDTDLDLSFLDADFFSNKGPTTRDRAICRGPNHGDIFLDLDSHSSALLTPANWQAEAEQLKLQQHEAEETG